MKVTLVSPFDPEPKEDGARRAHWGGVEQVFLQVSRSLGRRGHEVTLVCSSDQEEGESERDGVVFRRVRRRGTVFRTPLVDLSRHIPTDSDVVHVAATYPFITTRALRRAKRIGAAAVLDFHFEPVMASTPGRLATRMYRPLAVPSYRTADTVIIRSREYGRNAASLRTVPEERWRELPNGIDVSRFNPDGGNRLGAYLLFVGRLVPYKGLDVLIRALSRHPIPYPLYVVGDGPLRRDLEIMARRFSVNARFFGRVCDEDLLKLYLGARVTVLPSVNGQEAFGIALLESMACGTPVVASDLPGVRSVARLGGLLAQPNDPESLGQVIRSAVQPGRLPRGRSLAKRIHSRFSWEQVTDRLIGIYSDVLKTDVSKGFAVQGGMSHARSLSDPVL